MSSCASDSWQHVHVVREMGWHFGWHRNYQLKINIRDKTRYAPSQWETSLHCNKVSHWLGTYLDWSLKHTITDQIQARMNLLPLGLHSNTRPTWFVFTCFIYILLHVLFASYCMFKVLYCDWLSFQYCGLWINPPCPLYVDPFWVKSVLKNLAYKFNRMETSFSLSC